MFKKQMDIEYDMIGEEDTQFNLFALFIEATLDGVVPACNLYENRGHRRGVLAKHCAGRVVQ